MSAPREPRGWGPYAFIAPYVALTAVFFVIPFVKAIALAFFETNGPRARVFVGLANFRFLLTDPTFYRALANTTVFACASVFIQLPLSMGLALLLNSSKGRLRGALRLILFSPNLVGQLFVGILFSALSRRAMGWSIARSKSSSAGVSRSAGSPIHGS